MSKTIDEFIEGRKGGCKYFVCVPEAESEGTEFFSKTDEQWKENKVAYTKILAGRGQDLNVGENETLYIFEYFAGVFAAGGGVLIIDNDSGEILRYSQFWIS